MKSKRDRVILALAVLLECGLRRSELAALTFAHIQQHYGRWCIVDLLGKQGRIDASGTGVLLVRHPCRVGQKWPSMPGVLLRGQRMDSISGE